MSETDPLTHYKALLAQLADLIGLNDIHLNEQYACLLVFDDSLRVEIGYDVDSESLVISSDLGPLCDKFAVHWYPVLLEANVFWAATGGTTIGVYQATKQVIMAYREMIAGMTPERLEEILTSFTEIADFWKGRLQGTPGSDDEQTKAQEALRMMGMRV